MPPHANEKKILCAIARALGEPCPRNISLKCSIAVADRALGGRIRAYYDDWGGQWDDAARSSYPLMVDGELPGLKLYLEYDEFQHFTTARMRTLTSYPAEMRPGFIAEQYREWYLQHRDRADRYRKNKKVLGFAGPGARMKQRALRDYARDVYAGLILGRPVVRIAEAEVTEIITEPDCSRRVELMIPFLREKARRLDMPELSPD